MKRNRAFRPGRMELLEDRTVPSGTDACLGNLIASLPALDAVDVARGFHSLEQTVQKNVQTILAPAGTTNPASNRKAFDDANTAALQALLTQIGQEVSDLPSAAALTTSIQKGLLTDPATPTGKSLQELLVAVPSPTTIKARDLRSFTSKALGAIGKTVKAIVSEVAAAPAPTIQIDVAAAQKVITATRGALRTFNQAYETALKGLFQTSPPSANRAAFDTAVKTALTALNAGIATAVSSLPAAVAADVASKLSGLLLPASTPTGKSLQEKLAAIKTPGGSGLIARLLFRAQSALRIGGIEGQVVGQILSAIKAYNTAPVTGA